MPSIRRGDSASPKKVFRNSVEIKKIYRNGALVWAKIIRFLSPRGGYTAHVGPVYPLPENTWATVASAAIPDDGNYYVGTITATTKWAFAPSTSNSITAIYIAGDQIASDRAQDTGTGANTIHTVMAADVHLPPGVLVEIRCFSSSSNVNYRVIENTGSGAEIF